MTIPEIIIKGIIWILSTFTVAVFLYGTVYRYFANRRMLKKFANTIREIAKDKDPETKEKLEKLAGMADKMRKEEKLFPDLNNDDE